MGEQPLDASKREISMRKMGKPRHWILQTVYESGDVHNRKLFVTSTNIQLRAESAAKGEGVDVVFVLTGNADPDCPKVDQIVSRVEPRPFVECGASSTRIVSRDKVLHTKTPGAIVTEQQPLTKHPEVYTTMGRYQTC